MQREALRLYANLFVGRRDDYGVQQENGRYLRAGRPLSYYQLARHLAGAETIGTYVLDEQGTCRFAVFDDDTESDDLAQRVATLVGVQRTLASDGIPSYLEGSRRGAHLWVFCDRLVRASHLRGWLLPYCPAGVEFYPKQDEGTRDYGSLVRLPLGVHRRTNRRYWFFSWHDEWALPAHVYAQNVAESLAWLARIRRASVPPDETPALTRPARTPTTPSLTKKPSPETPFTEATIQAWCASQDPLRVIGRYVKLDRRGMGRCPFGEHHSDGKDSHPSFRVYVPRKASGSCWYCYTWERGGNVFNFLCYYLQVDARTLWHRILTGEVF